MSYSDRQRANRFFNVDSIAALKRIPARERKNKDVYFVQSAQSSYAFKSGATDTGNDSDVVTPSDNLGRWFLVGQSTGKNYKPAATTKSYLGTRTIAQIDALTPTKGDSVIAGSAGTPAAGGSDALAIGDVAEANASGAWKKILGHSGGFVPANTVLVISGGTLFSPLVEGTDENKVAYFSGTSNTPKLWTPADGETRLVAGQGSVFANQGWTFDVGVGWVQSAGPIPYATSAPTTVGAAAAVIGATGRVSDEGHRHQIAGPTVTNGGAGNSGAPLILDAQGKAAGRVLETDGAKLDGIATGADVTAAGNVAAAGAIMDGDFGANGLMERTGAGTYTSRAIVQTSAGAGDSAKVPALDASGKFAGSFLPSLRSVLVAAADRAPNGDTNENEFATVKIGPSNPLQATLLRGKITWKVVGVAAGTLTLKMKYGDVQLATTGASVFLANDIVIMESDIYVLTSGAGGTVSATATQRHTSGASAAVVKDNIISGTALDWTAANDLFATAQWSAANGGNTVDLMSIELTVVGA